VSERERVRKCEETCNQSGVGFKGSCVESGGRAKYCPFQKTSVHFLVEGVTGSSLGAATNRAVGKRLSVCQLGAKGSDVGFEGGRDTAPSDVASAPRNCTTWWVWDLGSRVEGRERRLEGRG